jgi:hypothetical protein
VTYEKEHKMSDKENHWGKLHTLLGKVAFNRRLFCEVNVAVLIAILCDCRLSHNKIDGCIVDRPQ